MTFLFATSAAAQEPKHLQLAHRLVEKALLHKMAALSMRRAVLQAVTEGTLTQSYLDCVSARDPEAFSPRLASALAEGLPVRDIKKALRFFERADSQRYLAYMLYAAEKQAGLSSSPHPTDVTADEQKLLDAFVSSEAGKQMRAASSALDTQIGQEIGKVVSSILSSCRN